MVTRLKRHFWPSRRLKRGWRIEKGERTNEFELNGLGTFGRLKRAAG